MAIRKRQWDEESKREEEKEDAVTRRYLKGLGDMSLSEELRKGSSLSEKKKEHRLQFGSTGDRIQG
jgi:hypothetical protein